MICTFAGLYPQSTAVLIESTTLSCPFRLVKNSNFAGTNVSKLIFTEVSPHYFSSGSFLARVIPLAAMANGFSPFKLDSCKHVFNTFSNGWLTTSQTNFIYSRDYKEICQMNNLILRE
jgi:hypothetical protein